MKARFAAPWLALALRIADCGAAVYTHVDPVSGMTVVSNVPDPKAASRTPAAPQSGVQGAAFPRVSSAQQKQMDGTRRDILQAELSNEQKALDAAAARRDAAEIVRRHVANVEALKRELAGVR